MGHGAISAALRDSIALGISGGETLLGHIVRNRKNSVLTTQWRFAVDLSHVFSFFLALALPNVDEARN